MKGLCILACVLALSSLATCADLSCKDNEGNPVDWFIVYKLPRVAKKSNPLIRDGVAFMYLDAKTPSFHLSRVGINVTNQAVGYTLRQIYDNQKSENVMYMLYNDQHPEENALPGVEGHAKGAIALDNSTGFWLVHSVPGFPNFNHSFSEFWPKGGKKYGQSMLCLSMDASEFVEVGHQLYYIYPSVFAVHIPARFPPGFDRLVEVAKGAHCEQQPWNRSAEIASVDGHRFVSFAKASEFHEDLYWYWVAPVLRDSLHTETYQHNSRLDLPSCCNGTFHVQNVKAIFFNGILQFKNGQDHSKWAVGKSKDLAWVCVGDINRMQSQYKRAGGTVCMQNHAVWEAFTRVVQKIEECPVL